MTAIRTFALSTQSHALREAIGGGMVAAYAKHRRMREHEEDYARDVFDAIAATLELFALHEEVIHKAVHKAREHGGHL